jgi:hypothetical protein
MWPKAKSGKRGAGKVCFPGTASGAPHQLDTEEDDGRSYDLSEPQTYLPGRSPFLYLPYSPLGPPVGTRHPAGAATLVLPGYSRTRNPAGLGA